MKLFIIVGVRPQFVKAAVVCVALERYNKSNVNGWENIFDSAKGIEIVLLHTGQHYDDNMSGVFFRELGLPEPKYRVPSFSGSAEQVVAGMQAGIVEALRAERPDAVMVLGDTNSTLAGALAAAEVGIPLIHVEAGERAGLGDNPEEKIRIQVDGMSDLLLCTSPQALQNLLAEGVGGKAVVVGNLMQDAFLHYVSLPWTNRVLHSLDGGELETPARFYLLTCHRQENSGTDEPLREILAAMECLEYPTVFRCIPVIGRG